MANSPESPTKDSTSGPLTDIHAAETTPAGISVEDAERFASQMKPSWEIEGTPAPPPASVRPANGPAPVAAVQGAAGNTLPIPVPPGGHVFPEVPNLAAPPAPKPLRESDSSFVIAPHAPPKRAVVENVSDSVIIDGAAAAPVEAGPMPLVSRMNVATEPPAARESLWPSARKQMPSHVDVEIDDGSGAPPIVTGNHRRTAAVAFDDDEPLPKIKKSGGMGMFLVAVLLLGGGGAAFTFRDRWMGTAPTTPLAAGPNAAPTFPAPPAPPPASESLVPPPPPVAELPAPTAATPPSVPTVAAEPKSPPVPAVVEATPKPEEPAGPKAAAAVAAKSVPAQTPAPAPRPVKTPRAPSPPPRPAPVAASPSPPVHEPAPPPPAGGIVRETPF